MVVGMSTFEKTESTIMDRWLDDEDDFEVVENVDELSNNGG